MKVIFTFRTLLIITYLNIVLPLRVPNVFRILINDDEPNVTVCDNVTIIEEESNETLIQDAHCDYKQCDFAHSIPNPIIQNPYKNWAKIYRPSSRPYGSVCSKCFACLAVSDQINRTLTRLCEDRISRNCVGNKLKKWEYGEISVTSNLNNLCINGFSDFRLEECRGQRFISYAETSSYPICSGIDGLWTEKLRKLCMQFIKVYGEWELLLHFLDYKKTHREQLSDVLCRGVGIFGECRNLKVNEEEMKQCRSTQFLQHDESTSIKICFRCDDKSINS